MLNEKEDGGVALGAEGARSTTGSAPSAAAEVKRWSSGRKKQVVLRLLRGESVDALSRELAVPIVRLEEWRDRRPCRQGKARMDHGTQYTAEDFLKPIEFWGIDKSFAFVAEPQTNGVAERFNRTLKEQAIQGRLLAQPRRGSAGRHRVQGSSRSALASRKTGLHVTPCSPAVSCHPEGRMRCKSVSNQLRAVHLRPVP
ncbi:MAG TPA: hypothetical protein VNL74_08345 [Methylococcus sp.]|nr:hypothetical protein [Methylococcus sp.]